MLIVALGYFYVIVTVGVVCLMTGHAGMGIFLLLFCGLLPLGVLIFINRRKRERLRQRHSGGDSSDEPSSSTVYAASGVEASPGALVAADAVSDVTPTFHHHHIEPDHHHSSSSHDSGSSSYDSGSSSSDSSSSSSSSSD
ncbi:hypothetical protein [Chitinimonas lacunae]|uniref:Uncharacterized protein n=1 Tax=Chitinimonas lacunae TaxID=1963018 RepID=A0ABV8MTY6_9NEIS